MKEVKQIRTKSCRVRLNDDEQKKLDSFYRRSTCNSLTEYARMVLLREPVIVRFRNGSADDFLIEMIQLKKELTAIGNNFNQAIDKLQSFDHDAEIKSWALINESSKRIFLKKVDEIKEKMHQIYELWSQE